MLSSDDFRQLLKVAKLSIEHGLCAGTALYGSPDEFGLTGELLSKNYRVYVSLNVGSSLIGCIGTSGDPKTGETLFDACRLAAYQAAFKDVRTTGFKIGHRKTSDVQVFVLTDPSHEFTGSDDELKSYIQKADPDTSIQLFDDRNGINALYLPHVMPTERGSDKYFNSLKTKAKIFGTGPFRVKTIKTQQSEKTMYAAI